MNDHYRRLYEENKIKASRSKRAGISIKQISLSKARVQIAKHASIERRAERARLEAVREAAFMPAANIADHKAGAWAVYFVLAKRCQRIKIGTTRSVVSRLKTLADGAPEPLECLGWISGSFAVERELHALLKDSRAHGEWFDITEQVVETLNRFDIWL